MYVTTKSGTDFWVFLEGSLQLPVKAISHTIIAVQ
jgi:hypothetical protein